MVSNVRDRDDLIQSSDMLGVLVASSGIRKQNSFVKVTTSAGITIASNDDSLNSLTQRCNEMAKQSIESGGNRVTPGREIAA